MKNIKLIATISVVFILFTVFANAQVTKHNELQEEKQKLLEELAEEKYQKDLIEALYWQRQEFIDDKSEIDEMIANLEASKLKKDEEIFRTESLIRCEKVNNNRLRGEAHDDCKLNWGNYPL